MSGAASGNRRYGGFDLLRIAAALSVILYHSFTRTGQYGDLPSLWVGHYHVTFGSFGVAVFFVISGFLIATSWDRLDRASVFVWHRFARIWPALAAVVLISVFVIGPLNTKLSVSDYLLDRRTMLYLGRDLTLFAGTVNFLPGVFTSAPRAEVNGSLWTLTYEVWAYVGILVLGMLGGLRRTWISAVLFVFALLVFRLCVYDGVGGLPVQTTVLTMSIAKGAELGSYFLAGTLISRIVTGVDMRRFALPAAILVALAIGLGEPLLFIPALSVLVIAIGAFSGTVTDWVHRWGDPSYGMYIFSFPIQQLLITSRIATTPGPLFVTSAVLSIGAGYLSWHLLEGPVLRWARARPRYATTARPVA